MSEKVTLYSDILKSRIENAYYMGCCSAPLGSGTIMGASDRAREWASNEMAWLKSSGVGDFDGPTTESLEAEGFGVAGKE
jgi:hypothetical protein